MSGGRRVAFLCLGVMGAPMAGHLARAGHRVTVWNRTTSRTDAWIEAHAGLDVAGASTPAEAAREAGVVFVCSGADPDLRAVVQGEHGAFAGMDDGAILVDHTTASAALARELADEAARRGLGFLDAPVSGGESGAQQGRLTVMLGGDAESYARVTPLLECYARKHLRVGPAGSGQLAKMVNQICIAGVLEGLSEGLLFGEAAGLDLAKVVEVVSQGAAGSWQMDNRAATMVEGRFDFGFAVDWMRKDLAMALEEAARMGVPMPGAELVDGLYAEVQREGGGRLDTSSLIEELRRRRARGETR